MDTKRIIFIDLARGLAIFFMILQHAMIIYARDEGAGTLLGEVIILCGTAPAAPVFMLIMGIFYLGAKDLKAHVHRGLKLIAMGYLLNVFRFVLPVLLSGDYPLSGPDSPLGLLMAVDILQMAGLSLICMSLIRPFGPMAWLGLALAVALWSPLLWQSAPQNFVLDMLWGTNHNVAFPLFPWLIYPLAGMVWGVFFNATDDIAQYIRHSAIAGAALVMVGGAGWIVMDNRWFPVGDYSRCGLQVHLVIVGFVLIWLWIFSYLEKRLIGTQLADLLIFWSKNVTAIYIIQWVLIGWGMLFLGYQQLTPAEAALIGLLMTLLAHGVTKLQLQLKRNRI